MRTGPARTLLAFGDSNTFGIVPGTRRRFQPDQRWTGVLQDRLGSGWDVLEAGLPGRTTDLEDVVSGRIDRAGLPAFRVLYESTEPDAVVLALGTNDLRQGSGRSDPLDVAAALARYIDYVEAVGGTAGSVIVVAPQPVGTPDPGSGVPDLFGPDGAHATIRLVEALEVLAQERGTIWCNLVASLRTGRDGAHLDADSHRLLGQRIADEVHMRFE